jgi:hypothetical protein
MILLPRTTELPRGIGVIGLFGGMMPVPPQI